SDQRALRSARHFGTRGGAQVASPQSIILRSRRLIVRPEDSGCEALNPSLFFAHTARGWLVGRECGARRAEPAEQQRSKENFVESILNRAKRDIFSCKQYRHINLMRLPTKVAAGADAPECDCKRIGQIVQ